VAQWIGEPSPKLRSIRQHKWLAAHFILLHAAGFLTIAEETIIPNPHITRWLHLPHPAHISHLRQVIKKSGCWQKAVTNLGLQNSIGEDVLAYLQQSFQRQSQVSPPNQSNPIIWLTNSPESWRFHLPSNLPLWLHFDLRQLGSWSPGQLLICTPLSIAAAVQRGYGSSVIQWILETAIHHPLSAQQQTQLIQWSRRANSYRIRTVKLLSTKQPQQMNSIVSRKTMRDEIIEQLSPRQAIVTTDMADKLEKWLLKQAYPLSRFPPEKENKKVDESVSMYWLGLQLLVGLGDLIPLPYPAPTSQLHQLSGQLSALEKNDLETIATNLLQNLRDAIHGRDAFFPSRKSVPPEWIQTIRRAINAEDTLKIIYQPLCDSKPSQRRIQPLQLEERGALFYIVAYCFRAEMNLTFRMDRIASIEV
jgi:hypothetical protein